MAILCMRHVTTPNIPYTQVNKRMLLIGAYTLISAAGLPALITLIKRICYSL